ncbi:unnamed protein product, partial [Bemisia tabaci]
MPLVILRSWLQSIVRFSICLMFLLNISAEHPSDQRNASDVFLKSLSDIVQELELRRMTSPIRCDESPDVREPFLYGDNLAARQEEHSHSHAEYHAGSISMLNRNDPFTKRSQFKEVKKFKRQLRNQSSGSRKQVSRKPKRMHAEFNLGSQNVLLSDNISPRNSSRDNKLSVNGNRSRKDVQVSKPPTLSRLQQGNT